MLLGHLDISKFGDISNFDTSYQLAQIEVGVHVHRAVETLP